MRILGIDVCTGSCAVAVIDGEGVLASAQEPMQRGHVERLAPMVSEVLSAGHVSPTDLHGIAVTTGPGSFTGARLGVSFARGLALSLGIPAIGVTVFEAMAADRTDALLIAIDGKRESVFAQAFEGGEPVASPAEYAQGEAWRAASASGRYDLIGSGAQRLLDHAPNEIAARFRRVGALPLMPETVAWIGAAKLRSGTASPPAPLYLRAPDAKPQEPVSLAQ